jgi:hypothetical protein
LTGAFFAGAFFFVVEPEGFFATIVGSA